MSNLPSYTDDNIKTLTPLEDFRINYNQYVKSGGLDTDCQLIKEIIQNSQDEAIDPNRTYVIKIVMFTHGNRYQVAVLDWGRGIPCKKLKEVYTERATSGKYDANAYQGFSVGAWGVGSKLVSALSRKFIAISKREDGFAGITIEKGVVTDHQQLDAIDDDYTTVGTTVLYETDDTILTESHLYMSDPKGFQETLKLLEYITAFKPNVKFEVYLVKKLLDENWFKQSYKDKWEYFQNIKEELVYKSPDDITPYEYSRSQFGVTSPTAWMMELNKDVDVTNPNDVMGYDIKIGCVKDCDKQHGLFGIVNGNTINSPKSSHICVLQSKLKERIVKYIDEDDQELMTYFQTQYELPIHGYTSVRYKCAKFIGQTKDAFIVSDFAHIYGKFISECFDKEPDSTWEQLYDLIVNDLQRRFLLSADRVLNTGKSLKNVSWSMKNEGCYIPCKINNPEVTELLITEGNSAGDYVKQVRNANYQAVLKMRGKPINAITADGVALRANAVYQDMVRLFGIGPRDETLDKFNYKSIGLLADADPDGYHILSLLIGNIYKINPLILSSGRVFISNPPLYVLESSEQNLFLRDQKALDDTKVMIYDQFFSIKLYNTVTGRIANVEGTSFRDFIYLVKRIGTVISDVSNKLVIDPFLLEQLVHCIDYLTVDTLNCNRIKEILNLESCSYHAEANTLLLVCDGMEVSISLSKLAYELSAYVIPELQPIHNGKIVPLVTTKMTGTYQDESLTYMQIYKIFSEIDKEYPVRRLKGLGECTRDQLRYTCVDPATRSYSTITSIGDVDRLFALLGVDTSSRKKLVQRDLDDLFSREDLIR